MKRIDTTIANIDIDSPELRFGVEVAVRQICEAGWSWDYAPAKWRSHSSALVWLIMGGKASLRSSFGDYPVRRGDFFVMPSAGFEYHGRHDPEFPLEVAWLFFRAYDKRGRVLEARGIEGIPFHTTLTDMPFMEELMERVLESTGTMQEGWLRVLFDEVRRQSAMSKASTTEQQIRELGRRIRANPGRYRGLDDMRTDRCYSKDHLIRLFRHYHGVTPGEFLIRARTDVARGLLAVSRVSVKQIAVQLGYADAFAFSRQFKARVGRSPTAFRKRLKDEG